MTTRQRMVLEYARQVVQHMQAGDYGSAEVLAGDLCQSIAEERDDGVAWKVKIAWYGESRRAARDGR